MFNLVKCAGSRSAFLAEKLYLAMKVQCVQTATHKILKKHAGYCAYCHLPSLSHSFLTPQGKGTRKHILTRIMVSRSEIDMKRIKDDYKKNYGKALYQDILVSRHMKTKGAT